MAVTGAIFSKQYANVITQHEQKKKKFPMQHLLEIYESKKKKEIFCHIQYCVHCVISIKENR